MMCKAKAWVLALTAGLLLLLIPAQARADVTRLLILNDEQTSETSAAATDVLRRFALYSSWTCTFVSSEDVPDTDGYTAVIICTDPNRALNASVALAIQESKLPVFVIGAGGLAELTKTQVYEGSLTLRLQTQANAANDMLLSGNSLLLMKKSGESLGGQIFVGAQAFPLCQTAGNITHLAYFDPSQEAQCTFLSTLLQTWLWPYKNSPTAYGQYLVLDRIYPFADPERLLSLVEMLETENVPYVLCVMPIYANADYPAMKRFCEVLRYAQSRGAGIVMHVPQVTLLNVTVEDLQENIANAYSAYSRYGVYPLAIEAPDVWLMSEKGQDVLRGWRTVFLFRSDEALFGEKQAENTALRDGHQIVAPAYADATAFTNAYAQAIYLDPSEDIETLRTQVNRLKNSRTALKKLSDVEGIVYAGDLYVHFYPADGLYVNGQAASLAYQRFNYDEDYVYDRGFVQYMTEQIQAANPGRNLIVVNTDNVVGGKGKSNALNIGYSVAKGSVFAIYDADNTPEPQALRILVENLMSDSSLGAVIGKFRTRNRNASLLTRFVNIETLAHQCMNQAGRWFYFGLCTIPGTNFVMHRHIIEEIGGWDPDALSEDTEISFRIYRMGYKIKLVPQAVTWEQEPFRLGIWFKQRTRWAMGNLYVLINNFKYIFDPSGGKMRMDVLYYALVYILMAFTLVCSDTMFVLGVLGYSHVSLGGLSTMVWVMACALFECNVMLTLAQEKNEFNLQSAALVLLMLFTYSKLWVVVVLRAMWMTVKKIVSKTDYTWYKTERSAD